MENPKTKWMMAGGTPIYGDPHITKYALACHKLFHRAFCPTKSCTFWITFVQAAQSEGYGVEWPTGLETWYRMGPPSDELVYEPH